ncbi:MAG: Os1348 family NHLP clan protein [Chloroflexi bacterium]|nr:Os1348 family NHLP clan protein [Chloroflexota bacterium]
MPFESLQSVVGTAVIDSNFRNALLNDSRRDAIGPFDLTEEETAALMQIRADTLEQFADQVHRWIMDQMKQVEPPPLLLPSRGPARARKELEPSRAPAAAHAGARSPAFVS